jgi:primosomal protein N'
MLSMVLQMATLYTGAAAMLKLARWLAGYYHHPLGDVAMVMLYQTWIASR